MKHSEIGLVLPTPGQWKSTVSIWVSCQADFFFNEQARGSFVHVVKSGTNIILTVEVGSLCHAIGQLPHFLMYKIQYQVF